MTLAVGGLIRGRVPQLEVYLRHLRQLDIGGFDVLWLFLLDNCAPETTALVHTAFPDATFLVVTDGGPAYQRGVCRPFERMADLRNRFAQEALSLGVDGLVSVDSDIVVVPDLIRRLVEADCPWVSALVDNSAGHRQAYNVLHWKTPRTLERRPLDLVSGGEADVIGAVCYYARDLLESVTFAEDPRGEDVGFALGATAAGYRGWYIPLEVEHLMTDGQLRAHLAHCVLCAAARDASLASGPVGAAPASTLR